MSFGSNVSAVHWGPRLASLVAQNAHTSVVACRPIHLLTEVDGDPLPRPPWPCPDAYPIVLQVCALGVIIKAFPTLPAPFVAR